MINYIDSLALSVYSNRGIYALLLGSGISRSAGIPTGWEITLDLIRKIATMQGVKEVPVPERWYKKAYNKDPDYSELLDTIFKSPVDRALMLKKYFEPNKEELLLGLKAPTQAHKSIAKLVTLGFIRVIVTTNFDRLLEKALEAVGVYPSVIASPDAVEGVLPMTHSQCTLSKLNGDYLDTRIKNTHSELAAYDPRINLLLDRIFDEYGLIVCGWSADWDTALRDAFARRKKSRFSVYWTYRGEIGPTAKSLINNTNVNSLEIRNADSFFQLLSEKIEALEEINKPHPASAKIATSILKKYLAETKYHIRLHDFVSQERESVYELLSGGLFSFDIGNSLRELRKRMQQYDSATEILRTVIGTTLNYIPH
ncbi:hypothetical protein GTO91_06080 [Heliobacterium undosum]|uniref:Deacetylase sirtuin-type domain-containing protein n=1 Tax=Heliomicrobium undosum TaxID=121734 RepID=A0A845L352_9FIRM|nr:SIR2 family protein [Heliomicrobium undosum]MZP29274.1 hypothetical protein [Heliomicrobium undosum]